MVSRTALLFLLVAFTTHVAAANFFPYEKEHLTAENIEEVLNDRLPKQSRILGGAEVAEFLSTFLFSSVDVTSDHNTKVDYDLQGSEGCKVFPGDVSWPSKWLWSGLKLATLGGLIKPVPVSSVCYANGTGEIDEAACESLAENWNTAKFMYVSFA